MKLRLVLTILAISLLIVSFANMAMAAEPSTQFANIAPLPGAGIALNADGRPDGNGALQVNIPVAYTPGEESFSLSFYGGSHIGEYDPSMPNGTSIFSGGFGTWPRVYFSAMQVSSLIFKDSKALSAQVQVLQETKSRPALAFGGQDILNKEWQTGPGRGYYGVATKAVPVGCGDIHLTLGYGTGRFLDHLFGGVSVPLGNMINVAAEYDGYQLNEGVAFRPGGRFGSVTLLAGYNDRCGLLVGAGGAGKMPTVWQLAIGAALLAIKEQ